MGPVIANGTLTHYIGDPGEIRVAVPDALFKIVIKEDYGEGVPDVLAFLFPHTHKPEGGGRC